MKKTISHKLLLVMLAISMSLSFFACNPDSQKADTNVTDEETSDEKVTLQESTDEETTVNNASSEETTLEGTALEETTIEETTVGESTAEETTLEETTVEDTTVEETTVEETTVEETTVEETTVEETTLEETTVEETTEVETYEIETVGEYVVITGDELNVGTSSSAEFSATDGIYRLTGLDKTAQHTWLREEYIHPDNHTQMAGGGSKMSEKIDIDQAELMVIKLRSNADSNRINFVMSTTGYNYDSEGVVGYGVGSVANTYTLLKTESELWYVFVFNLNALDKTFVKDAETGTYILDTFYISVPSLATNEFVDIAYIAFADNFAEVDAIVEESDINYIMSTDGSSKKYSMSSSDFVSPCIRYEQHRLSFSEELPATLLTPRSDLYVCPRCGYEEKKSVGDVIDPATLDMPIVYIEDFVDGSIPLADLKKADGEIIVKYKYVSNDDSISDFDCYCEIKIQGASSASYAKKNFTVKFYKDYTDGVLDGKNKVDLGWGKENKYCMKANYVDPSQTRNIVAAKLFGQVVASRDNITEGLENAPNFGAIDGYPVLVYLNGEFHGLYTMNIPKDDWQFGMEGDETAKEALLMADGRSDQTRLLQPIGDITGIDDFELYKFEVEYASNEDDVIWIRDSFNAMIEVLNCGDAERIKKELPLHLDIEAAIDNMIFTYFISAGDNLEKNILWATYDGTVWIPSMYDMDGTFGMKWDGAPIQGKGFTAPTINSNGSLSIPGNKMYSILCAHFGDEVVARYTKLRESILTEENTKAVFKSFFAKIDEMAYTSDMEKWGGTDQYEWAKTTRSNMYTFVKWQLVRLDNFFLHFNK